MYFDVIIKFTRYKRLNYQRQNKYALVKLTSFTCYDSHLTKRTLKNPLKNDRIMIKIDF